ncbi:hypothetical protein SAMN04488065_2591 [Haloplanus vescus]|uniref:Uncharacterized protein n=1 Tax=Haloplanus vescus TaxID=555874 RepID=A0A1H3ZVM5_9EURY|nr:hypothetical protein SAMN04488065_2497 [Haloplanus vescus]SEA29820.1 hypothetical protein SAMN04488065_2591 [Haloplanus vescus]
MCKCIMAQASPRSTPREPDTDERSSVSIEAWLEAVSRELDPAECEDLSELGIYSIHEHSSARTITLPENADEFEDATTVKQYYFEGEGCPLLIVAPLQV